MCLALLCAGRVESLSPVWRGTWLHSLIIWGCRACASHVGEGAVSCPGTSSCDHKDSTKVQLVPRVLKQIHWHQCLGGL